jgi:hypothetical protein
MVRIIAPGVEKLAPGHEHADRVQRQWLLDQDFIACFLLLP